MHTNRKNLAMLIGLALAGNAIAQERNVDKDEGLPVGYRARDNSSFYTTPEEFRAMFFNPEKFEAWYQGLDNVRSDCWLSDFDLSDGEVRQLTDAYLVASSEHDRRRNGADYLLSCLLSRVKGDDAYFKQAFETVGWQAAGSALERIEDMNFVSGVVKQGVERPYHCDEENVYCPTKEVLAARRVMSSRGAELYEHDSELVEAATSCKEGILARYAQETLAREKQISR